VVLNAPVTEPAVKCRNTHVWERFAFKSKCVATEELLPLGWHERNTVSQGCQLNSRNLIVVLVSLMYYGSPNNTDAQTKL
jgi:hypothetical protein